MKKGRKTKAGMTLIETIVAFAIISIIIVVAVMGVNTIAGVSSKAQKTNISNENIELLIAQNASGEDSENVNFSFATDEETFVIKGNFRTYTDELDGKPIIIFIPKDGNKR